MENLLTPHRQKYDGDPDGKYDYLCQFDATLNCAETNSELPFDARRIFSGYITTVERLSLENQCGAIITPDGQWHDIFFFGYALMDDEEAKDIATVKWRRHLRSLLLENPNCWVVETWAHS